MNKVFKIIWSQALKSWVVASELSKNKTKSKSSVSNKTTIMVLSALASLSGTAYAQQGVNGGQASGGSNGTAISACTGNQQAQAKGNHAIAIGCQAEADNNVNSGSSSNIQLVNRNNPGNPQTGQAYLMTNAASTAIGYRAKALNASIALGDNAQAMNVGIAIGLGAESLNNSAIALGSLAQAKGNTSFALGRQSVAESDFATAIGNVAYAKSESSIAMGHSATAEGYRAIAIGAADSKNAPDDGVSRGAGYQVNSQTLAQGEDSIALGGGANATKSDALAIGAFSKSTGTKAVAIGTGSHAGATEAVAIGQGATALTDGGVALGRGAKVNEIGSIALGQNSVTSVSNELGYLTGTAAPKSIVSVGSVGNERRIQNVSAGAKDTDGVNVSQLKAVHNIASKGWNVTTQGVGTTNVAPGGTVDFANTDGNILVSKANNNLKFNLNKNLTADSVTINNGGPVINNAGINLNNTKIINLTEGTADGDAVNVKQLTQNITNVTNNLTAKGLDFSGNAGDVVHRDLGSTLAIKGAATTAGSFSGSNLKTVTGTDGSINLQMADAPKFGDITINNDGKISGVKDGVDGKDAVNVDQLGKVTEVANKGWNVSAQGGASNNVKPGDTVDFANTDGNIVVSRVDNNLNFDLAADLTGIKTIETKEITSEKIIIKNGKPGVDGQPGKDLDVGEELNKGLNFAGNVGEFNRQLGDITTIKGGATTLGTFSGHNLKTVANADGSINLQMADAPKFGDIVINHQGRITGVKDGVDGKDAVNVDQLGKVSEIANKGWNVTAQGADGSNVAPGDTVDFANTDGNIVVSKTGNNLNFDLAADLTGIKTIETKEITSEKIIIKNGKPGVDGQPGKDLDVGEELNKGLNFTGNVGEFNRQLGDITTIKGDATTLGTFSGGNLKTVANEDGTLNLQMADAPKFGDITINNEGKISGVAPGVDGKDAVNVDQLTEVSDIAKAGWMVTDGTKDANIGPYGKVTFVGDDNVLVAQTGVNQKGEISIALNKAISVESITSINNQPINVFGGLNIATGGFSVAKGNTINMGGNQVTNVANATERNHAVNLGQLDDAIDKLKWHLEDGTNPGNGGIVVKPGEGAGSGAGGGNGGVNPDPTVPGNGSGSQPGVSGGNTVVMKGENNIKVSVDGSNNTVTIGTAGRGDISKGSGDVITGGQIHDMAVAIAVNTQKIIGGKTKVKSTRDGQVEHTVEFNMAGGTQNNINDAMKAIDNSAVHYDKKADGSVDKSKVTLGEKGTPVTVGNVAAGKADTDAVNVSQLKGAVTKIDNQFTEVNNQIGDIHNNFGRMDQKINDIDKDSRAGVAAAMAAAGLPQAYLPGKSMMAIAGSTWRGQSGYAIGVSTISDNGNWVVKANVSGNARSQYGASAGMGYQW